MIEGSQNILYSVGKNDECYTPPEAVYPLLPYLSSETVYWLPFDKETSHFHRILRQVGLKTVCTHIDNGQDFHTYTPDFEWGAIVSNPPFTRKADIFRKALSYDKPFALLMSNTWLNDSAPKRLFWEKPLQLLMFCERIRYLDSAGNQIQTVNKSGKLTSASVTFSSSYFCYNLLPKQIIMSRLEHNQP